MAEQGAGATASPASKFLCVTRTHGSLRAPSPLLAHSRSPNLPARSYGEPSSGGFTLGDEIGRGSFAIVRDATKAGVRYACKVIVKSRLDKVSLAALQSELDILGAVHHPHIVELVCVFDTPSTIYLIMALCSGGELFDRCGGRRTARGYDARECEAHKPLHAEWGVGCASLLRGVRRASATVPRECPSSCAAV